MKKPIGLVLVAGLLILLGLRTLIGIGFSPAGNAALLAKITAIGLGAFTIATGVALFQRRPFAIKLYFAWTVGCMIVGAAREYLSAGEPLIVVVTWSLLLGGVWIAVGFYLRDLLRRPPSVRRRRRERGVPPRPRPFLRNSTS